MGSRIIFGPSGCKQSKVAHSNSKFIEFLLFIPIDLQSFDTAAAPTLIHPFVVAPARLLGYSKSIAWK